MPAEPSQRRRPIQSDIPSQTERVNLPVASHSRSLERHRHRSFQSDLPSQNNRIERPEGNSRPVETNPFVPPVHERTHTHFSPSRSAHAHAHNDYHLHLHEGTRTEFVKNPNIENNYGARNSHAAPGTYVSQDQDRASLRQGSTDNHTNRTRSASESRSTYRNIIAAGYFQWNGSAGDYRADDYIDIRCEKKIQWNGGFKGLSEHDAQVVLAFLKLAAAGNTAQSDDKAQEAPRGK